MIERFRSSVLLYHDLYISRITPPDEPTDAQKIGTALHALVLEPENFKRLVVVGPDCDRRSNVNKARWAEFELANSGATILKPEQFLQVRCMANAVSLNPLAVNLLAAAGKREQSVRWKDAATGLTLKARFDILLDAGIIVDVKTTSSLAGYKWRSTVNQYGLHRQAALYMAGWRAVLDGEPQHLHLVFTNETPYEVAIMQLDADALNLGDKQNRASIAQLAEHYATNLWPSRHAGRIVSVSLPKFAFSDFFDEENQP